MKHPRRSLLEQFLAFLGGLMLGLVIAWVIAPVRYTDAPPSLLRADFKDAYRLVIARAWAVDGDLPRARQRLAELGDPSPAQALALQAQRALADHAPQEDIQALADLAILLRAVPTPTLFTATPGPSPTASFTPRPTFTPSLTPSPTPTRTPSATPTPTRPIPTLEGTPGTPAYTLTASITPTRTPRLRPTHTPTPTASPTPGLPFIIVRQETLCDPALPPGLLQIYARDAADHPVPGVMLKLAWPPEQEARFFTGLKPDIDLGYADYQLQPHTVYALTVLPGGTYIPELRAPQCTAADGQTYAGSLLLELRQP